MAAATLLLLLSSRAFAAPKTSGRPVPQLLAGFFKTLPPAWHGPVGSFLTSPTPDLKGLDGKLASLKKNAVDLNPSPLETLDLEALDARKLGLLEVVLSRHLRAEELADLSEASAIKREALSEKESALLDAKMRRWAVSLGATAEVDSEVLQVSVVQKGSTLQKSNPSARGKKEEVVPALGQAKTTTEASWLSRFFARFRRAGPEAYLWPDGTLSQAQWRNLMAFSKRVNKVPPEGAEIRIRPANFFKDGQVVSTDVGVQTIRKNGDYEKALLAESRIDSAPREVLRIAIHLDDGTILETPIVVYGNARWVNWSKAEAELQAYTGGRIGGIAAFEITHTHPSYEVRVSKGDLVRIRSNELSEGDVLQARELASRVAPGRKIIMRAVTPNGYTYEMTFKTG